MPANSALPAITRLYQACEPQESLAPSDPRWVDFDPVRGEDNVVEQCARSLRRADPAKPYFGLFSGHRGVGKTSELQRLKAQLEAGANGSKGFLVVFGDVSDALDVNDLDFPDLLVFIAAHLQKNLAAEGLRGFNPITTYLTKTWDDICALLTAEVELKNVRADTGFGKLTMELRNRPNSRSQLRDAVEKHSTSLLQAVNDLLDSAQAAALSAGFAGMVLIIDGLDKLVRRGLGEGSNTHDRLFIDRCDQLASLKVHTIYTVPISLIYSPFFAQVEETFGKCNAPVSMIRLHSRFDKPVKPDSEGMLKMREMVDKRCSYAGIAPDQVFDAPATLEYLCEMSGGHPRHLMMFVQAACNELDDLPITRHAADKAVRRYANALLREVPDAAWDALAHFKTPQRDIPKDDLHQQMMFLLFVFEYMNGAPWYELNPVLRTLERLAR
ncbi:MAG TPA: hypothetical protein PK229_16505 [Rhodocyclaceae bacterium]|nr:hypothetical protein [Rhodocyclaceae bacterium]